MMLSRTRQYCEAYTTVDGIHDMPIGIGPLNATEQLSRPCIRTTAAWLACASWALGVPANSYATMTGLTNYAIAAFRKPTLMPRRVKARNCRVQGGGCPVRPHDTEGPP